MGLLYFAQRKASSATKTKRNKNKTKAQVLLCKKNKTTTKSVFRKTKWKKICILRNKKETKSSVLCYGFTLRRRNTKIKVTTIFRREITYMAQER